MRKNAKYVTIMMSAFLVGCGGNSFNNSESTQTTSVSVEGTTKEEKNTEETSKVETIFTQDTTVENQTPEEKIPSEGEFELLLNIQCEKNMLLDKFDVNLYVDDEFVTKIDHGASYVNTLAVDSGMHVVKLTVADNETIFNEEKFNVKSNAMFNCKLQTHSDNIEFKQVSIVGDSNAQIVISMTDHEMKGKDYEDVEATIRSEGFTNVVTEPVYDIVFGVTREKSVAEVIIGKTNKFKAGDVFDKDTEVKIVYHMKEDDNPAFISLDDQLIGKNYKDVEKILVEAGCLDVETIAKESYKEERADIVWKIDATPNDVKPGAKFDPNKKVIIYYAVAPETIAPTTAAPKPTVSLDTTNTTKPNTIKKTANYHSSGDREIAKEGNTGVYAFKNKERGNYNIYYIVDFDGMYAYYFTEGNGENTCEKVHIEGDLNQHVVLHYHDPNGDWDMAIRFKMQKMPDNEIVQIGDNEFAFMPTDLEDALALRSKKTIVEY